MTFALLDLLKKLCNVETRLIEILEVSYSYNGISYGVQTVEQVELKRRANDNQ